MPYLLDADVLIRAKRDHYRFKVFPVFWNWIEQQHHAGVVFSVERVGQELAVGTDDLAAWVKQTSGLFLAPDTETVTAAQQVSTWVQDPARPYTPAAVSAFFSGGDYWLTAHALAHTYTVVTHEVPDPFSKRRVKIPDVCAGLGVTCTNPFQMLEDTGASFQ
jgi:hypothetical protein